MVKSKKFVLKEFPSAYYDPETREVRLYSEGFVLGRGDITARSSENDAWRKASRTIKKNKWATSPAPKSSPR